MLQLLRPVLQDCRIFSRLFTLNTSRHWLDFAYIYGPGQDFNMLKCFAILWDWRINVLNTASMFRAKLVYELDIYCYRRPRKTILVTWLMPDEGGSKIKYVVADNSHSNEKLIKVQYPKCAYGPVRLKIVYTS